MGGITRLGSPDLAPIDRVVSVVDLRMLGAVEAVDSAGHGVKLGGARQRGLLALLALSAPNMVATDTIVEAIWGCRPAHGDKPPQSRHWRRPGGD